MAFQEFLASASYSAGDYVWLDRTLFRFVEDHPAGPWNGRDVQKVSSKHLVNMLEEKVDDSALTGEVTEILGEIATPVITEKVNELVEPAVTEKVNEIADEILEAVKGKANAIEKTVTNSGVVSIDDGSASPVAELVVGIEPVQDLHGQDNPYPAGGGKNLLPTKATATSNQVTFTLRSDGGYDLSGTADGTATFDIGRDELTLPAGTYYASVTGGNATVALFKVVSGTASVIRNGNGSFTLEESTSVFLRMSFSSGTTASGTAYAQIESGSSATSYAPYANICPISGHTSAVVTRTGRNLFNPNFDFTTLGVINCTVSQTNGEFTFVASGIDMYMGTLVQSGAYNERYGVKHYCKEGQTLKIVTSNTSFAKNYVSFFDKTDTVISATRVDLNSFTVPDGAEYFVVRIEHLNSVSGTTYTTTIMVVDADDTDTTYSAYQGTTVTVALGDTIYGGSLDVTTGVLTVTHAIVDLGTLTWRLNNSGYFYAYDLSSLIKFPASNATVFDAICDSYKSDTANHVGNLTNGAIGSNITGTLMLCNTSITTVEALTTALDGVMLCYALATPLTVQLTESDLNLLDGENHVWADCGDIESFVYRVGMKMYIDDTVATQQSIIGTVELGTASQDYSVNDFLLMNNTLYKVTSPIGTGNTITVGTNVQATTIAEQLSNLLNA